MKKKVLILPMTLISILGFSQYSISEISKDAYLKDFDIAVDIIKSSILILTAFTARRYWKKAGFSKKRSREKSYLYQFSSEYTNKSTG